MATVNEFLSNIRNFNYNESDSSFTNYTQTMVVWKEGDFVPFNFEIRANNAWLNIPKAYNWNTDDHVLIEDNNPSIREVDSESANNIVTLNMRPIQSSLINCEGAINTASIRATENPNYTIPPTGMTFEVNGLQETFFLSPDGIDMDEFNSIFPDLDMGVDVLANKSTSEFLRVRFQFYPPEQDAAIDTFFTDNPTSGSSNGWATVCLAPDTGVVEGPLISCDNATDYIDLVGFSGHFNIEVDNVFYSGANKTFEVDFPPLFINRLNINYNGVRIRITNISNESIRIRVNPSTDNDGFINYVDGNPSVIQNGPSDYSFCLRGVR